MGLFQKKRKIHNLGEIGIRNPLEVIPVVEMGVEARRDKTDMLQIRREMQPKPGIYGWVSKKLKFRHDVRVNLDEVGSFFWEQIDGRRTLGEITKTLRKKFDIEIKDAREAVVTFTKALVLRHLMYLRVPAPNRKRRFKANAG